LASQPTVAVIGLGRFGKSLALELMEWDTEVLGIDIDLHRVESMSGQLTHVVRADSTDEDAMRQLSVHELDRVVIGIGGNLEASILTASVVLSLGVKHLWAKAVSHAHARILTQLGVPHVVRPEHDMGERIAHLVRGRMLDYIEFDDRFAMAKTTPPTRLLGRRLGDTGIRASHGVTVVAVKSPGSDFTYATPDTVVKDGDNIIVSGSHRDVERFSSLT